MLALQGQLESVAAEEDVEVMAPQIGFILSEAAASSLITENQQVPRFLCWERTSHCCFSAFSRLNSPRQMEVAPPCESPDHHYGGICSFLRNLLTMIVL